jgi:hypothetical protein
MADRIFDADPELRGEAETLRQRHRAAALEVAGRKAIMLHEVELEAENGAAPAEWPVLDPAALYGLAGDVVRTIEPHSEADPVAILAQFLVAAGNAIGRGPFYLVEGARHHANLFITLIGHTSKGRKGTSWERVRNVMLGADPTWAADCVHSGASSGEGLIHAVRDRVMQPKPGKKGGPAVMVEVDPGIADKRLLDIEYEFAGLLTVMRREGNILSRVIRDGWDHGTLRTLTKHSPCRATGAHLSLVGHITLEELRREFDRTAMANGFGNRFLWFLVRRSKVLPFGGFLDDEVIAELGRRTAAAIEAARLIEGRVQMTREAKEAWRRVYPKLSEDKPGLLGALTARAEAQVVRLGLLYALLGERDAIGIDHLRAALALWQYADDSVRYVWGDALGDPIADTILRALRHAGAGGMTRTEISGLFGRHESSNAIGLALSELAQHGKARCAERETTGGRPAELWVATGR